MAEIATRFISASEAGITSELASSLSIALSKRQDLVLSRLDERYVCAVCSAPFVIDFKFGLQTLERTTPRLLNINLPKVDYKKKLCLFLVNSAVEDFHSGK